MIYEPPDNRHEPTVCTKGLVGNAVFRRGYKEKEKRGKEK